MSEQSALPEFDELADMFLRLGALQSPSELHGYLVGELAAGNDLSAEHWVQHGFEWVEGNDEPQPLDQELMMALYQATLAQLQSGMLDLQLLLPDEDSAMEQRLECLGQWCLGFLSGFASTRQYSDEINETLTDLAAISQVAMESDDEDLDQEQDYLEVSEYVRLTAVNLYLDSQQAKQPAQPATAAPKPTGAEQAIGSPRGLFSKKLH